MLLNFPITTFSGVTHLAIAIVLVAVFWLFWYHKSTSNLALAPQPSGLPLLGNLPEFIAAASRKELHLLVEEWHRTYGDVIRVKLGPVTLHFIGSDVAVKQIFDKNSAYTAERPRWIYSNETHCNKMNVLLLDASDSRWKHQRKVTHAGLTSIAMADKGLPYLNYETVQFLGQVADDIALQTDSKKLFGAIGRYTYSTFAQQTFGMEIAKPSDPVIDYIFETGEQQIQGTLPGSYLVDLIPALSRLPSWLKPWDRTGRARFARDLAWTNGRLHSVKRDIPNGYFHDAFLYRVVSDDKRMGFETEEEAAYLALMLIIGAADTSRMSTWAFLESMMLFPEVQKKLQQEIDSVVGDRLPVYEDIERIPYVRCVMKEVWRFRPPVALGHPHRITKDLTYNGFLLPKGSRVQICAWTIGHDPKRHPDPERFMPERYADDEKTVSCGGIHHISIADPNRRWKQSIRQIRHNAITSPSVLAAVYVQVSTSRIAH